MAKKKKGFLTLALGAFALTSVLASTVTFVHGRANGGVKNTWSGEEVADSYAYGSTLTIPDRTIGGEETKVSHTLIFPDGTATYADEVTLNKCGEYELIYTATVGGKAYSESHEFTIDNVLYSVSKASSSLSYATPTNVRNTEQKGLMVELAKDDVLTFNQAISVESLTTDNYFVEGFIYPEAVGTSGFSRFIVTLTDMSDPDVYLKILICERLTEDDRWGQSFIAAGGNGQDMVGIQAAFGSTTATRVYTNDGFGNGIILPFKGKETIYFGDARLPYTYEPYADDYPFRLSYDKDSMEVWHSTNYMNPALDGNEKTEYDALERHKDNVRSTNDDYRMIATELDNPNYYSSIWSGFKSGFVKLSVQADRYNADLAKFCITKVAGVDLSQNSFEITEKPVISVTTEELPEAKVGVGYPIPLATAQDVYDGEITVSSKVVYNYNGDNPISATVVDGKFVAQYPGYYAIVYTATNSVGISSEEVIWVHASNDTLPLTVEIDEAGKITQAKVLESIAYASATVKGGVGDSTLNVYAKQGDTVISTKDGFRPEKTGEWEIVYEAIDYIGQKATASYTMNVVESSDPVLEEAITLPKVYVSGGKYTLPKVYANVYVNGAVERVLCDVKVNVGGNETTHKAGDVVSVSVENKSQKVNVKYLCNGVKLYEEDVSCIVPYKGKALDYAEYFVRTNAALEKTEDGAVIKSSEAGDFSFFYANPLVVEEIEVGLRCEMNKAEYKEILLSFIDAADYGNVVEVKLVERNGRVTLVVGDASYATAYAFSKSSFDMIVDYQDGAIVFDGIRFPVTHRADGTPFEGFKSDKVYVDVSVKDAKAGSELVVPSIRGYLFNTQKADVIRPYIQRYSDENIAIVGERFTVAPISTGDMISPSLTSTVTVLAPDGSVVEDINGVKLENVNPFVAYTFDVERIGGYKINYVVVEDNDFEARPFEAKQSLTVSVYDTVDPTVKITSNYTKEAKVGEVIVMPNFTATDNHSLAENLIVYTYIENPTGTMKIVTGNSVTCSIAGVYTWNIVAIDEAGNIATYKIAVTVRAK